MKLDELLDDYDRLVAEGYALAGHSVRHGVGSVAPLSIRKEHHLKVLAARAAITSQLVPREAVEELVKASQGLKDDLLMRAEIGQRDAVKVVAAGNGAWFNFCEALASLKENERADG